jgi:hypothetical protein
MVAPVSGRAVRRRLVGAAFASGVVAIVATVPLPASPASAEPCAQFSALAAADGARALGSIPGFLTVDGADAAAPAAQAYVDSSGRSDGYAGFPYPGATVLSGLALGGVSPSKVPLVAHSNLAQPHASSSAPGAIVTADSDAHSSSARGEGGIQTSDASSAGSTRAAGKAGCADDGKVSATAESTVEGVTFGGGVLRIGAVHATAEAAVGTDGTTHLQSHLDASDVMVLGQAARITEHGLELPGGASPLPDNPFVAALQSAGITVDYVAAVNDADGHGVVAPAARVTVTRQTFGTGPSQVEYTFGRVHVRAEAASFVDASGADATSLVGAGTGDLSGSPSAIDAPSNAAPPAVTMPADGTTLPAARLASGTLIPISAARIYPVLVAAAIAVLLATAMFRLINERSQRESQ